MTYLEYKTAIDGIHERMNSEGVNNVQLQNDLRLLESIYRNELKEALEAKIGEMDEKELDDNIAKMSPDYEAEDEKLRAIYLDPKVNEFTSQRNINFTNIEEINEILDMYDKYLKVKIDYVDMLTKASSFKAAMSWFKRTDFYKNNQQSFDAFEKQMNYHFNTSDVVDRHVVEIVFNETMGNLLNDSYIKSRILNEHHFEPEYHDRTISDPLTMEDILYHVSKSSGLSNSIRQNSFESYFKTTEFAKQNPDFSVSMKDGAIAEFGSGIQTLRTLKDVYMSAYQKYAEEKERMIVKPQEEIKGRTQTIDDKKAYLLELITGRYVRNVDVNKAIQNSEMLQELNAEVPEMEGFDRKNKEGVGLDDVLSTSSTNLGGLGSAVQELSGIDAEQEQFNSLLQNYETIALPTYNSEVQQINGQRDQIEAQLKEAQDLVASLEVQLSVKQNEKVNIFNKNKHTTELAQITNSYNEAQKNADAIKIQLENINKSALNSHVKLNAEYAKLVQSSPIMSYLPNYLPHQTQNIRRDATAYFQTRKENALRNYREAITNYVNKVANFFKTTPDKLYERFNINLAEFQPDILSRITLMAQALNEAANLSVQDDQVLEAMKNAARSNVELAQDDLNTIISEESPRHR